MDAPKPPVTPTVLSGVVTYLDPFEVALLLRVSIRYVYEHCEELGGFRLGKVWRFRSDKLPAGPMPPAPEPQQEGSGD